MSKREWCVAVVFWAVVLAAIAGSTVLIGGKQDLNRREILTSRDFKLGVAEAMTANRLGREEILVLVEKNTTAIQDVATEVTELRGQVGKYLLEKNEP